MHHKFEAGLLHQSLDVRDLLREGGILGSNLVQFHGQHNIQCRYFGNTIIHTGIKEKSAVHRDGVAKAVRGEAMVKEVIGITQGCKISRNGLIFD